MYMREKEKRDTQKTMIRKNRTGERIAKDGK